jgi:hypothetical protein
VEPAATVVVMAAAVEEETPKPNILTVSLFVRESAGSGFPDFKAGKSSYLWADHARLINLCTKTCHVSFIFWINKR